MQEGVMQIGAAVLSECDILTALIQKVDAVKKGKQRHILKFNFSTIEDKLHIDVNEEMKDDSAARYMFIGSNGSNIPQWYVTSASIIYHLTETIYNLTAVDFGESINNKIKKVFENYYVDLGSELRSKNRYILNLGKFGICEEDVADIYIKLRDEEKGKEAAGVQNKKDTEKKINDSLKKVFQKKFEEHLKVKYDLKLKDMGLFTILIDDEPLCELEEYKNTVIKEKKKSSKGSKENNLHKCSMCGKSENLSSDMTSMKIKYYTTNQIIFASNLSNYDSNMLLCRDCLDKILAGESYIKNNLDTRLTGFTVYLAPHFVYGNPMTKEELDSISAKIKSSFNTVKNFRGIDEFNEEIENIIEANGDESYYLLNIIFYKKANQATKVQRLIKDINPSIFNDIVRASRNAYLLSRDIIGKRYKWKVSLETFYYMTPIRVKDGEPLKYKYLIQLYDAIFTKRRIKKSEFIKNIVDCARVQFFEEEGYNVKDGRIHDTAILGNLCLKFLEYLGCIEEVKGLDVGELRLKDDIKNYISKMNYDGQQSAMFLLGYLVGEVGNAQYKRMGEDKKPVLNKLNFAGVDKGKIIRLSNDIFNKLKQEKILKYNETIFNEFKKLMDFNFDSWKLNKQENLFYILSGYGYATTRPMVNKDND